MGDTTWRMFVPTIGLALLGYWLDRQWHTAPWVMLLGLIIGSALAGLLVRRQLKKVNE